MFCRIKSGFLKQKTKLNFVNGDFIGGVYIKIKVCDALMGSGKTSAAINYMNRNPNKNFIFITPFLEEVKRIKNACFERKFVEPFFSEDHNKLDSLKLQLKSSRNVASTHALFKRYDPEVVDLIRSGNYTLILDEVADVVEMMRVTEFDVGILLNMKMISIDERGGVHWIADTYPNNGDHSNEMRLIKNGHVVMDDGQLMLWLFPAEIFEAFDNVIVLTHMFDAQVQKYYYDYCGLEYEYIGLTPEYEFCDIVDTKQDHSWMKDKIHIIDDQKLNEIGNNQYALSVSWFDRDKKNHKKRNIEQLHKTAENVVRNRWNAASGDILWSTFIEYKSSISGKGYARSFLEYNARATNNYRERKYLMYFVNIFFLVDIKSFFLQNGIIVNEDRYALSVMLQWLWRSAIREHNDVYLFLPSSRMRRLLTEWIQS